MVSLEVRPGGERMIFEDANATVKVGCDGPKAVGIVQYLQPGRSLVIMRANFH